MGELILIVIAIVALITVISWLSEALRKVRLYDKQKERLDKLDDLEAKFKNEQARWIVRVQEDKEAIERLAKEKCLGFPWLASAYADYFYVSDLKAAEYLKSKSHPAKRAAEVTKDIASKRRTAEKLWRINKYQLDYYEVLFPWLTEFKSEEVDDLVRQLEVAGDMTNTEDDPAKHWLTQAEFDSLTPAEKNQLALDRYWQKQKNKWELGRDYERFVGYQYEAQGWQVCYQGIVEGFADLGRDLIVCKGNSAHVVQCKYWSQHKTIHEKHVCQLFGTVIAYKIDHPDTKVSGVFVTSTGLSDRAKVFANALKIMVREHHPLQNYPCVKCNVSQKNGAKIYHLPFDQQYDRTVIERERNECFVASVKEAEEKGFRRAFRWRGKNEIGKDGPENLPIGIT